MCVRTQVLRTALPSIPKRECRPPFRLQLRPCLCLLLILFLVALLPFPAGAYFSLWLRIPIPSPLLPRSDQPRVAALNKRRRERGPPRAPFSSIHLTFLVILDPLASIASLSLSHPRLRLSLCLPPRAATTASHTHHQLVLPRLALLRALHSRHKSPTRTRPDRTRRQHQSRDPALHKTLVLVYQNSITASSPVSFRCLRIFLRSRVDPGCTAVHPE